MLFSPCALIQIVDLAENTKYVRKRYTTFGF